jgi:hypothetical protein
LEGGRRLKVQMTDEKRKQNREKKKEAKRKKRETEGEPDGEGVEKRLPVELAASRE